MCNLVDSIDITYLVTGHLKEDKLLKSGVKLPLLVADGIVKRLYYGDNLSFIDYLRDSVLSYFVVECIGSVYLEKHEVHGYIPNYYNVIVGEYCDVNTTKV